jgi:hypothetical protein
MIIDNGPGQPTVSIRGGAVYIDGVPESEYQEEEAMESPKSDAGICIFKCKNHESIVAASKVVWDEGVYPHRVVLRKETASSLGGDRVEYVTHMENLVFKGDGFEHSDFYWGHYFGSDEAKAIADYQERCKKL